TSDPAVLAFSVPLLTAMGLLQPPMAVAMTMSGALRGAGETRVVLLAAVIGGWLVRLPCAYAGGIAAGLGMIAVWTAMVLDWVVRGAILSWRFRRLALSSVRL
ncbi:MAG: MATE family efflux transporter, partial [Candidatus Methylomirabilota bacterium]